MGRMDLSAEGQPDPLNLFTHPTRLFTPRFSGMYAYLVRASYSHEGRIRQFCHYGDPQTYRP